MQHKRLFNYNKVWKFYNMMRINFYIVERNRESWQM